ncbi:aldo/keto reductase [uncultured Butyricimonas sp.]|uniref:aldo/keto reductase family protein n=1 Tax=uncultured Butyricimonas sp. TaxID=1268785 RepID=UPI0026DB034A|nr:aldo/keto reductase [uncultured Butyricimonas sp.]
MEYITLNNGVRMPQVGLGTFLIPKENLSRTIAQAYEMGYRQFDTAWRYHNEADIARALKSNGIKREDVFITTKVNADALYYFGYWYGKHSIINVRSFKPVSKAIQESFDNLATDYIDLFLVHWPWPIYRKMYKQLTKFYKEGRIRAIGVCSCLPPHLEALKEISDVVPAVNQFEISPLNTQKELIKYCEDRGIQVEAMSTFSHFRSNMPRNEILENVVIQPIAEKYKKSVAQVILRWLIQQKIIVIPKTWNDIHLKENISLFDFALTDEEMIIIDSLDQGKFLNYNPYNAFRGLPKKYKDWKGF